MENIQIPILMDDNIPKDVSQYQKHYSDKDLLDKIKNACKKAGLQVIYYVLLLYYVLKDENTPAQQKMIIIGALGYFILPVDLVPDLIPVAGYADDAAALIACLKTVADNVTPEIKKKASDKVRELFGSVEDDQLNGYDEDFKS